MNYDRPELRDQLAAAYVLGTLRGRARERFDRLLSQDRDLQALVADWIERFMPIGATPHHDEPSPEVWAGIEQRIRGSARPEPQSPLWARLFGEYPVKAVFAGLATCIILFGFVIVLWMDRETTEVLRSGQPPVAGVGSQSSKMDIPILEQNQPVGFLVDPKGEGTILVRVLESESRLEAEILRPFLLSRDQRLQLWALRSNAPPESFGVITPAGRSHIALSAPAEQLLADVSELAVSVEPHSAEPAVMPTLPYLSRGPLIRMR